MRRKIAFLKIENDYSTSFSSRLVRTPRAAMKEVALLFGLTVLVAMSGYAIGVWHCRYCFVKTIENLYPLRR